MLLRIHNWLLGGDGSGNGFVVIFPMKSEIFDLIAKLALLGGTKGFCLSPLSSDNVNISSCPRYTDYVPLNTTGFEVEEETVGGL